MDGWHAGRLLVAAEFTGKFLKVRIAVLMRGEDPVLLMEIVPDIDVDIDEKSYAQWSSRFRAPVPKGWEPSSGNPWRACRYAGPLRTLVPADVDRLIKYVSGGGKNKGARLAGLINAHLDSTSLVLRARRKLSQFVKEDFATATVSTLVRPEDSDDIYDLTLGSAQDIHQAAAVGERLPAAQRRAAEVLLKDAPWQFGYWGPFKALVKSAPAERLADAYAVAVARLSSADGNVSVPTKILIENDDAFEGWFGIPTKRTQQYMARRVRRDLASLAHRSPDVYARVASRMLISWDEPLSNYSFAPAFVMLGAGSPLNSGSRYVRRPADMAVRQDPHPEVWDARPDLVEKVFRSIRTSVEALTWAFQVLESVGSPLELPPATIPLALDSSYAPLRQLACAALPNHPKKFGSLTDSEWAAFFRHGSDTDVVALADALTNRQLIASMGEAIGAVLAQPEPPSERRLRLALLYLASPKVPFSNHAAADIGAVIAALGDPGLEHQSLWGAVLSDMDQWGLVTVYRSLVGDGVTGSALDRVSESLLAKNYHAPDLILEFLGSDTDKVAELGWKLVDAHGGRQFLFTQLLPIAGHGDRISPEIALRVVTATLPRVEESQDLGALIRWALSTEIDRFRFAELVVGIPVGPIAVWESLATDRDGNVAEWVSASSELVQLIGDALTDQQVATATPAQLRMMLRYIEKNPSRIVQEDPLLVAAVRSIDPDLQAEALRQLSAGGTLQRIWLTVAESGLPAGLEAAREYLESLTDDEQIRRATQQCLASASPALQDMGIQLCRSRDGLAGDPTIAAALASTNDQRAQELFAEAAFSGVPVSEAVLRIFDRRILTDHQTSPRVKDLVKRRLEASPASSEPESADRIAAALQLARTGNKGDREWALMRLATWALHGADIEGLEVSLTTEGMVGLEDVAP